MKSKLQKLRQTSFDELRVRGSQALAAFIERRGWTRKAKLISDETLRGLLDASQIGDEGLRSLLDLRDHFRKRTGPAFFPAFDDPAATTAELRQRWPNSEPAIIARADRLTEGYFDLLGFCNLSFGTPIDWHLEPIAGKRAPLVHWSRLNYLDAQLFGDKKIVWELNRHQYFATLGQAYWLTGDERYAETFAAHINQWMDRNPPKLGVNWASSLEVAFRSISWLWALHYFKESAALTPQTFLGVYKFLYLNARHLETYLSTYFSPNTHLTGEALGLFYLGTLLPEFKESARWKDTGLQILTAQLARHVQSDGVYFEHASYYHRYTTDFYLHLLMLLNANAEVLPSDLDEKLGLLLDHLMYITRPDGTTPLFGDDDGGRLFRLDYRPANDFRATLSTGAALLKRSDYKFVSGGAAEETLWLLGHPGLADLDCVEAQEPARQSIAFAAGGYYIMRDGWAARSNYLLFDCGPHGTDNCGHAHADALSFELAANGHTLLVDPGTYTYTGSREMRDWFRSSAAHNTLTLDEESSSVSAGPFSWEAIARSACSSWITQTRFDYVVASHDGFRRLPHPAVQTRAILFLKNNYWVLRDRIESLGDHELKAWFHFDSRVAALRGTDNTIRVINDNGHPATLEIAAFARNGAWREERGWVSHCYGEKEEAPVFAFSVLAKGSDELVTFLLPEVAGVGSEPKVREIEALDGRAFEINIGGKHDVLMLRGVLQERAAGRIETAQFASDFDVTWARFDSASPRTPEEFILIGGQTLTLEGRDLLKSTRRINYLVASRVGDRFRLETDEGVLEMALPVADLESLFANLNQGSVMS
jgi:Heparinase II/III-like protein/Heparinase II/III N-terminus